MSDPDFGGTYAYTPNQFTTLCEEVDRQGGAVLPDRCEPEILKYTKPSSSKIDLAKTCSCDNESMAAVPYTPASSPTVLRLMYERGAGFARVCLLCDGVGLWPRFAESLEDVV